MDAYLRAFDAKSGRELWLGRLPVPGVANPMTYLWKGEQHVAIGAGGHSEAGTSVGDSVVAFRLPRAGEGASLWSRMIDRPGGRFAAKAVAAGVALVVLALRRCGAGGGAVACDPPEETPAAAARGQNIENNPMQRSRAAAEAF